MSREKHIASMVKQSKMYLGEILVLTYFVSYTFYIFINFYEGLGHYILFLHVFDSDSYNVKSTSFTS